MCLYNAENWKSLLLQDIDADELPVHWGGTATDPDGDPHCRSRVLNSTIHMSVLLCSVLQAGVYKHRLIAVFQVNFG